MFSFLWISHLNSQKLSFHGRWDDHKIRWFEEQGISSGETSIWKTDDSKNTFRSRRRSVGERGCWWIPCHANPPACGRRVSARAIPSLAPIGAGLGSSPAVTWASLGAGRERGSLALSHNKRQDLTLNLHEFGEVRGAAPVPKQTGTCGDTCPADLIMLTCKIYTKKTNSFSTGLCSKVALSSAAEIFVSLNLSLGS